MCGREGCGFSSRGTRYHPDFPAASPYITAVGGTDFLTRDVIGDETTWPDGGGGFSDTFAIPDYQAAAVSEAVSLAAKEAHTNSMEYAKERMTSLYSEIGLPTPPEA